MIKDLPSDVRARVEEWTKSLEKTLGDELVGILVHGSVARGEYRAGESDVDAIVVLKKGSFEQLEAIANAMQLARYSARIEAMILTEAEIAGASDVFPLLYDDIKRCNLLVAGKDPFKAVEVHDTHRRLRVEQELREARIRMRRAVTDAAGAREALGGAVTRKVKQVRAPLHALLSMKGIACKPDLAAVTEAACKQYGVDAATVRNAKEAPNEAFEAFTTLLDKAIDEVNAMEQKA